MSNSKNNTKSKMVFIFDPVSKKMRMIKTNDKKMKVIQVPPSLTKHNKD